MYKNHRYFLNLRRYSNVSRYHGQHQYFHSWTSLYLPVSSNQTSSENVVHKYSRVPALPCAAIEPTVKLKGAKLVELPILIPKYIIFKIAKYLENIQQSLANEMPDTFKMLHRFTEGLKEFLVDLREYVVVLGKLALPFYHIEDLSRRELVLYYNMPQQIFRVLPVIAISSLPFAQNVALPVAYVFPKQLLCYQFWDAELRSEISSGKLRKRLYNARPVFRCLQSRLDEIADVELQKKCQAVFFNLGSGIHPNLDRVLELQNLFEEEPFNISYLLPQHVNALLRLHGRSVWVRRRNRLREHVRYIRCLDLAIHDEGINSLNNEQLRNILFFRGVNPIKLSRRDMMKIVETWILVSIQTDSDDSLILHLPIFIAYNHPGNVYLTQA